jgi:hypothetical protein
MKKLMITALLFCSLKSKSQTHCDTTHWYTMAVKFSQVSGNVTGSQLNVNFSMADQTDVKKYVVMVSYDGKTFVPFKDVLVDKNKFTYTVDFCL